MSDDVQDGLKFVAGVALMVYAPGLGGSLGALGSLAGSALITSALTEDPSPPEAGIEGALANSNSNKAHIPVIYGTRRVGGTRVFMGTHGTENKFLDMVIVLGEGPIKGFRAVYVDDAFCKFQDFGAYRGNWIRGSSFDDEGGGPEWTQTYEINDIVFHDGQYWIATALSHDDEPAVGSAFWDETTYSNTILGVDSAGTDIPLSNNEYGNIYFQVGTGETTALTAGKYVTGLTSGATAKIVSLDGTNHRIYVDSIQNNTTTNKGFAISEVLQETTGRGGTSTGNTATGTSPMKVVEPIYFKDHNDAGNPTYTITGEVLPTTSTKLASETKEYEGLIQFSFHNGSTTQTADTALVAAHPDWTTNHQLKGKAYIYVRLEYNKDRMIGLPDITALIDGREVFDPRDSLTKFSSNPALCVRDYLTNTQYGRGLDALSIDDTAIITESNYCDEIINITGTEWVEPSQVGTLVYSDVRYRCNARLDTGQTIFNNIKILLASMRGYLVFSNGFYKLLADKEESSYHTFSEENIIQGIQLSLGNKRNTFNEVKVTFPNAEKNWDSDEAVYFNDTIKATLDNDLPLIKDISLSSITNYHQAIYIGLQEFKQSRQALAISFKAGIEGLLVESGDVIRVRSLKYGWGTVEDTVDGATINVYNERTGANISAHEEYASGVLLGDDGTTKGDGLGTGPMYKEFKVLGVSLDSKLETTISALEYDPTVYTTYPATLEDSTPNTNMSDTRVSLPPNNVVANEYLYVSKDTAGFKTGLQLSWDSSDSAWDQSYQISVKEPHESYVSGNAYAVGAIIYDAGVYYQCTTAIALNTITVPGTDPQWTVITDVVANTPRVVGTTEDRTFNLKDVKEGWHIIHVKSVNVVGKLSEPSEITYNVQGLSAPPANVTGLGLIVNNDNAVLTWNKATDLDVLISGSVQIRHNAVTNLDQYSSNAALEQLWQSATTITEGKSGATTQVFLPLKVGTYLVKFVDASGVPSAVPAAISNTISPAASSTLVSSFSELTDFTTAPFDGLTAPADPGGTSVGFESVPNGGQQILQFTTTAGTTFADPPIVSAGTYYLHNEFQFTSLVDAELSVDLNIDTYNINNLVTSWVDIDTLTSIDDDPYSANVVTKISTTQDDPADANAIWSDYFTFLAGTIKCRGARALVEISVNTATTQVNIKDIEFKFYGKDRPEVKNNLEWNATDYTIGYKDVWYDSPFFDGAGIVGASPVEPILNVNISSQLPGISYTISNGTQPYKNGPGTDGPDVYAGFRIVIFQSTALNTTTIPINSTLNFGYQAIGY